MASSMLARWREAEALADELLHSPASSQRVHAAHQLATSCQPGGCLVRLRAAGSGDFHFGAYSRDAYAGGVATSALCSALLTDASVAVREAAMAALHVLQPVGDEGVKHALLAVLELRVDADDEPMRREAVDLLVHLSSHHDLELVARLAMLLEAGGWEKSEWTDAKYEELCAMLPPPGRTLVRRPLRRLLAGLGEPLYTGRTLSVVLPASSQGRGSREAGLTTIAIPAFPDADAGSLVGMMLLLSEPVSPGGRALVRRDGSVPERDVLGERTTATSLGTPGGGYLGPPTDGTGGLQTEGRMVTHDSVVHMLRLEFACLGRALAKQLNPQLAARSYTLTIEGEKLKDPLVHLRTRGVLSPVFKSDSGEDGLHIALEDVIVNDKGMDSVVLIELRVWGGSELGNAKINKKKGNAPASGCMPARG